MTAGQSAQSAYDNAEPFGTEYTDRESDHAAEIAQHTVAFILNECYKDAADWADNFTAYGTSEAVVDLAVEYIREALTSLMTTYNGGAK